MTLTDTIEKYPYFIQPLIDALSADNSPSGGHTHNSDDTAADGLTDPDRRARLKARLAVNVSSTEALREILALDSESLADFYGDNESFTPSTIDTINTFLSHFGHGNPASAAPLQDDDNMYISVAPGQDTGAIPIAPAANYALTLENLPEADAADDDTSSRIDAFLQALPPKTPRRLPSAHNAAQNPSILRNANPENNHSGLSLYPDADNTEAHAEADDTSAITAPAASLTEGFARILIKNGNFSKALDIITRLNLNNPEKSIYFADQIRFLRKLIANQNKS